MELFAQKSRQQNSSAINTCAGQSRSARRALVADFNFSVARHNDFRDLDDLALFGNLFYVRLGELTWRLPGVFGVGHDIDRPGTSCLAS